MTLKEIAARAGVSVSTVSRVVNSKNAKAASPEVCERIWKIVRETGYTPNSSAQHLQHGTDPQPKRHTKKIFVIFARKIESYIDPFFTDLLHAIEKEAFSKGYPVQAIMTDMELQNLSADGIDHHAAAIILGQISDSSLAILRTCFHYLTYVGLNALPQRAMIDQVLCSGYEAARSAVDYLTKIGHRKIHYVGETHNEERYAGFLDEMKAHGLSPTPDSIHRAQLSPQSGYECMASILVQGKQPCSAILCTNDDTAIGVVRALVEHGIQVPRDISVMGMDDIEMSRYLSPMLTTIHIPTEEMGVQAAKLAIDRMEGGHKTPMKVNFPSSLSPRESCAPPKK